MPNEEITNEDEVEIGRRGLQDWDSGTNIIKLFGLVI
jgi:hypothetical protein